MLVFGGCTPTPRAGLPEGSPFLPVAEAQALALPQGIASGDVTHESAVIWARTDGPAALQVEWWPASAGDVDDVARSSTRGSGSRTSIQRTTSADDFTAKVRLSELRPDTVYRYRVWTAPLTAEERFAQAATPGDPGRFRTAPDPATHRDVRFAWSGDLGGQGRCRQGVRGYPILDRALEARPQFFLLLGDLIYGDERCPSPPNDPGSDFVAGTLDEYRGKHRYQRGAPALRQFLLEVPVWAMWDDHEVRNNFSGPFDPQMPAGRQALFDYWPIRVNEEDPTRLYRSVRYGAGLELFILDTRQYRSRNQDSDGSGKTLLGSAQLAWLIDGVTRSTATWKVIATSVPLSYPTKRSRAVPGNDGWARGVDGTGFETELTEIVQALRAKTVRNLVWLAGDVHYVQGAAYDPDGDGKPDFHEFIAGPLSAYHGRVADPHPAFGPTRLFAESGFDNFGVVTVTDAAFRVELVDADGRVRYQYTVRAEESVAP